MNKDLVAIKEVELILGYLNTIQALAYSSGSFDVDVFFLAKPFQDYTLFERWSQTVLSLFFFSMQVNRDEMPF